MTSSREIDRSEPKLDVASALGIELDMVDHKEILRSIWTLEEIPSLSGKVALVTGANKPDGIGYHVAHQLALKGTKVYVGARSAEKANGAIQAMLKKSPELDAALIVPFVADMGNPRDVQQAARALASREDRLDLLVNNAAVLLKPLEKDSSGISVSFATNHLGAFVLARELTPLLIRTGSTHSGVRVVNVASTAHYDVPLGAKFDSLEDFNNSFGSDDGALSNYLRYGYSKLANILHIKELQRQLDEKQGNVLAISVHPGVVTTGATVDHVGGGDDDFLRAGVSPLEGAITPLYAAVHPEPEQNRKKFAGSFVMPFGGLKGPSEDARNLDLARQLWIATERVLNDVLT